MQEKSVAIKVSYYSLAVNIVLSVFKFFTGIIASSRAMVSDAVHSASDVLSTVIVMAGIKASDREADEGHQYGHEKMESIAGIVLAVMLFMTGAGIGFSGAKKFFAAGSDIAVPGKLALFAAVVSVIVKEIMFQVTHKVAKKVKSSALSADAWHHRSDALSSIGSFAGILSSRLGFVRGDSIACFIISLFIMKAAYDIFKEATDKLVDKSCDSQVTDSMNKVILEQEGVIRVDDIRTRLFGNKIYVDVEISADGGITLEKRHGIAEAVHRRIENNFVDVKHCMVHVNPYK